MQRDSADAPAVDLRTLVRRVARIARQKQLTLLAAGVAFYAFLSLIPLVLLGFVIVTVVGGEELALEVTDSVSGVLTPSAQELLTEAITEESGRGGATVVGVAGLLWGGSRVLRGLDKAFSDVYGTACSATFVGSFRNAGIVIVAVTLGVLAVAGAEAILAEAAGVVSVITPLFALLTLLVVFLPLYVVFPGANVDVAEALPGAALAAVGWVVLGRLFGLYAAVAGTYALYGALGAVFLVLTWLYVGSLLLVVGAVVNAVLAGRDMDRQLQSPRGRQVSTGAMTDDATGADDESPASGRDRDRTRDRADDPEVLREEIARLRDELEAVEENVERRTVTRDALEADLKRYVRRRVRRGHAHGWGPYLVLLYGTAMTVAGFYLIQDSWAAVAAMFVVWTSTLGVYVLMVIFGVGFSVLGVPGRLRNRVGEWRS